jgi:hypothetical protein
VSDQQTIDWLLAGDAAIHWQVMRDLVEAPSAEIDAERARVTTEGWGAQILAQQHPATGMWGGGLYSPKWTSTHYTLQLLAFMGAPADDLRIQKGVQLLLGNGVLNDGGVNYSPGAQRSETCESGMLLAIASTLGAIDERVERIAAYIFREQMGDGGWNCQRPRGATHASFHTTICVLEGLARYRLAGGPDKQATLDAELRGREFLAAHRLFRSHRTGDVVRQSLTMLSFPGWWHYDVLRALDYLQSVNAELDGRFADGIALLEKKRRADGTWPRQHRHAGEEWFEMERAGKPSRWNTLRALRVLRWWGGQA